MSTVVEYFFDGGCPWTWATSRWLVEVATARGFDVRWRPFSLAKLHQADDPRRPVPGHVTDVAAYRARSAGNVMASRVVAALDARGEHIMTGAFYTEWGRRVHHDKASASAALVHDVIMTVGLPQWTADAAADPQWDTALLACIDEAMALAGPDVGSPVLVPDATPRRGMFGPIMTPAPTGAEALRVWDAVVTLAGAPQVFELKHGRLGGPPQQGPRP
jgi:2-hydroxychromene-2-carboxylate isomerase